MSEIIGIIGAGTMGNGIAQTAASAGFDVVLCDTKEEFLERGVQNVSKSFMNREKKNSFEKLDKSFSLFRFFTFLLLISFDRHRH